jgi:hypothetical protein
LKTGSAQPYLELEIQVTTGWDFSDEEFGRLALEIRKKIQRAKREHPIRNSPVVQILFGERSLIPRQ